MTEDQPRDASLELDFSFIERKGINPALFAFLCLGLVFLLYQVGGGVLTFLFIGANKVSPENVGLVRVLTMVGQVLLILLPTLLLARLLTKKQGEVFPLRLPTWKESVAAAIGLISLQRIFETYVYFQDRIILPEFLRKLIEPLRQMMEELVKVLIRSDTVPEFVFVVMVVAIVPSIAEEFLFRGLIQKSFNRVMNPLLSALLSGTIFGLFHLNPFEAVPLIAIGCFLGFLRYRSNSIALPVLVHFLNNFLAVIAVTLNLGDEKIMMAPRTDQPGVLIALTQLVLFLGLFLLAMRVYVLTTISVDRRSL
jgi:membrane protease YdiL (CAAX protease family)